MLGLPDQFEYFECAHCGCLQIKKIPADLSKYYPEQYHSFNTPAKFKDNFIKAFIKKKGQRLVYIKSACSEEYS